MPGRSAKLIAASLALFGCASNVSIADLPEIGRETTAPPEMQRDNIVSGVEMFAKSRFQPETPRWFILENGVNAASVFSRVDSALGKSAERVIETGPDEAAADMRVWKLKGKEALVVAVVTQNGHEGLAAYYPVQLDDGWTLQTVSGNVER